MRRVVALATLGAAAWLVAHSGADALPRRACPAIAPRWFAFPRVIDGDTFWLHGERIRVRGIDTPERGQPGAREATQRLRALLASGSVVIVRHGKDVYCRTLADVYVNGSSVAGILRREGYDKDARSR